MACLAKNTMLSKKEVCDLTDRTYEIALNKLSPAQNKGCLSEANKKTATMKQYRSECVRPIRGVQMEPTKKSPVKISPRTVKATSQYADFRKRNHVSTRRHIYDNIWTKGIKNSTLNILDDLKTSAKGLINTGYGLGKIPVDFLVGTYHGLHGIGHGIRGLARLAKQTFRLSIKSWAHTNYIQKKQQLLTCTNCKPTDGDCCTEEEIQQLKHEIDALYEEIKKEEIAKRDYLLEQATEYATANLQGEEATTFLKLSAQQIENEFVKSLQELTAKKGGRSRRRR